MSGMIPWLLVAERICHTGQPLSTIVDSRMQAYPCSGEINFEVADTAAAIECVLSRYTHLGPKMDHTDGVSAEFADWRFNLRAPHTEPPLRLNVESRGDTSPVKVRTEEIAAIIRRRTVVTSQPAISKLTIHREDATLRRSRFQS
jgi:phosphomannomutase